MPLDPRAGRFLHLLAAANAQSMATMSVAERRAGLADLMRMGGGGPEVADIVDLEVPSSSQPIAARLYTPMDLRERIGPGLAYFHGGGFVAGSIDTHEVIARELAGAGRCRVVSIGYRLAPEHRFPAAIEDAQAAVRHIAAHAEQFGIDAARFGVCGDSAGATLAAVTCQSLAGTGLIGVQLLICPILDYAERSPSGSRLEYARGYLVDEAALAHDLRHYLRPGMSATDPRVSPLRAAYVDGLPPALIHTAECDPLRDEGAAYAAQLSNAGCPVTYTCHAGMIHLFYGLRTVIPAAGLAWTEIGGQLRTLWG